MAQQRTPDLDPAADSELDVLRGKDRIAAARTEKPQTPIISPVGRILYGRGWGSLRRCYRHNLPLQQCPTKTRCILCRMLSRVGWGLIHLSQWVAKGGK